MDPDIKKLLEDNLILNKENNEMLRKLFKVQRFAQITRIVYWIVLVGIAVGAFYFVQPFIDNLLGVYGMDSSSFDSLLK